jgi:hypothetical protein
VRRVRQLLPSIGEVEQEAVRIAIRPIPGDHLSTIGRVPRTSGYYIAVTHSGSTPRPAAINATLSEEKRDVTTFTDNDFHNIGIGIIRHNVVALAQQAEQMINSGHLEEVDRAAVGTDFSALGRFLISKKEADIAAFKTPDIRNILVTGRIFTTARKKRCGTSLTTTTRVTVSKSRTPTKTSSPSL